LKLGCWDMGRKLKVWFMISGRWANEGSTRRDRRARTTGTTSTRCLIDGMLRFPFKPLFSIDFRRRILPRK